MKIYVVTAAVLAALASRAVLAASEGGDTWSAVQPAPDSAYSVAPSASHTDPMVSGLDPALEGSEGGDTWSSVEAVRGTGDEAIGQGGSGQSNTEYARTPSASEGGDTWSSIEAEVQSHPISLTRLVPGALFDPR